MAAASSATELLADPLLRDVPTIEGCKVLAGVALYARLGQGGMGVVYRGRHCLLDVDMAVKCLKPSLVAEDERSALRFRREAQVAAQITHQNVVRLYDANQQHGLHYLLMEFVDGESVRDRVRRKGPLKAAEALGILLGAASGLAEAHRVGVVHRDVKPDNILVARDGRVKVADLGLVKRDASHGDSLSLGSGIMGTPQYMAPEQWDSPDVTAAADVWALGATLWYMLVGSHAIEGTTLAAAARRVQEHDFPSLREQRPELRPELLAVFERCVQRRPAARFADARQLVEALLPLVPGGEALLADPEAGLGGSRPSLPTPPPRAAIERIRDVIGTGTQVAGTEVRRSEAETILSAGGTLPTAPPSAARPTPLRRWRVWIVGAFAVLAAVLGYGMSNSWFRGLFTMSPWERSQAARLLVAQAQESLRQEGGLDDAIAKLERALDLDLLSKDAKKELVKAYGLRVDRVLAKEPHAQANAEQALADGQRAFFHGYPAKEAQDLQARVQGNLEAALAAGIHIQAPPDGAVITESTFYLSGRIDWQGIERLTLSSQPPGGWGQDGVVLDGREFRHQLQVAGVGWHRLRVRYEGSRGAVEATLPSRWFTVGHHDAGSWLVSLASGRQPVLGNAAAILMRPVPPRTFLMGSRLVEVEKDEDETQHEVTLTQPFWLGETEVTRAQWMRVMKTSPWAKEPDKKPGDEPAIDVTWVMAVNFCERLTAIERTAGRLPPGYVYCLPTEAQWELAAHGGEYHVFPHGDERATLGEYAVFGDPVRFPQPVASKKVGPFGLYDLAGNVDEWCADRASGEGRVSTTRVAGSQEPLGLTGPNRIYRGGNFGSAAIDCRCAARAAAPPDTARATLGFRVALAKR